MLVGLAPNFSAQEKDEASRFRCFGAGFVECLHSPYCGVWRFFYAFRLRAGLATLESPIEPGQPKTLMIKRLIAGLALASVILASEAQAASYATSVISYTPGTLSGSVAGYTNAPAALGSPATENPAFPPFTPSPTPITPFEAPYTTDQLMAIGAGGSLTVHFADPIRNQAGNPYGLDFLIYGGVSLIDAAWPNGVSDGTVFGNLGGSTRISVSQDGVTFYQLNPSLAPVTEAGLPTDAAGTFGVPANPALQTAAFNGLSLAQIRALYGGSAGGTGYDLAWALDGDGQSVNLTEASYVKVDVLTGQTKLDAIAAVPEPGVWILGLAGLALLVWRRRHQHAQA